MPDLLAEVARKQSSEAARGRARPEAAMIRRSRLGVVALLVSLGTFGADRSLAAETARASGVWIVAGEKIELAHARAFREADPFGRGTNPCVLVSNESVPDDAVPEDDEGIAELLERMRNGTLRALQVCFDASGKSLRNVNDVLVFHPGISPGRFGFQGHHRFAPRAGAVGIAGRLSGAGTTAEGVAWSDEVEIEAELPAE